MKDLYLVASVGGQGVAIPAEQVSSVVDIGEITVVPRAPAHVRGLAALRSRVLTVIDASVALGLPPGERGDGGRAVITQVDGHAYALLVDDLDDVTSFEALPLANGVKLSTSWATVARGVVLREEEALLIVDLAGFVPGTAEAA